MPDSQVERFSIGVLYRLSGLDELLLHVMFCGLAQYSIARKLRAVIKADCFRQATLGYDELEGTDNVGTA